MTTGVLLMTYGSPSTLEDIPAYLQSIRRGSPAPPEVIAEFQNRYKQIGMSPLVQITNAQAWGLQQALDQNYSIRTFKVEIGMLHSEPTIDTALKRLATASITNVVALTLAPQYSPLILSGYQKTLDKFAAENVTVQIRMVQAWHKVPQFTKAITENLLAELKKDGDEQPTYVIFTAHSLPKPVMERDPSYLDQIHETIDLIVEKSGLQDSEWQFAYQSAGHTPQEWLKPDLSEVLEELSKKNGVAKVLVVPVQFVADHLETLYDLDIAATQQAKTFGIELQRISSLNTHPKFIEALANALQM